MKNYRHIQHQVKKASDQIKKLNNISSEDRKINRKTNEAGRQLNKLDDVVIENPSQLIKYRQNITVPAMWVPQQGVRSVNLGIIPAENIFGLSTYITANTKIIDGGDLDNPQ